ncbi:aldolase [Pleurotus eryngii]|uniref:Aldolase n=1 Tax=Pleurotus eryngii TaxID=5323 RepID=A0A9P5ZXZ5_PLEER|nr:aldolase [Pleurotus eryngii]
MANNTLLAQIRGLVTVDVDSMDPEVAAKHTTSRYAFSGMTSNQAIVCIEAVKPERKQLALQAIALAKSKLGGANESALVDQVVDILTVLLAKEVYPIITANVYVQTSPAAAYNTEETVRHAKSLVALFNDQGIPKHRVCIKIPATPQSLIACRMLSEMGIQTLATCLFSLPQALAAAQANCICISPYFNELRVHFEPTIRKVYENVDDDPMCAIIHSIVQHFKAIKTKTLIMPASIVTVEEVLALVRLNPDRLTLSGAVLDQLAALEPVEESVLQPKPSANNHESYAKPDDFLADGGKLLEEALASDTEATRKLADALKIFGEQELLTKAFVKPLLGLS